MVKMNAANFEERARSVHGDKYDYSKAQYEGTRNKVIIICSKHGEFQKSPTCHIHQKQGCPSCSGIRNLSDFLEKARSVHGDKYDYSKAQYEAAKKKVIIICSKHGEFQQSPTGHIHGEQGCPSCVSIKNLSDFLDKARSVHGDEYDYSKVHYTGLSAKVVIVCAKHGEFMQTPKQHANEKAGCQKCGHKTVTRAEFLEKAEKVHGAMFKRYDYSKIVALENACTAKVEIICKLHGTFQMTPSNHMLGQGCKKCKGCFSLIAIAWLEYIARTRGIHIKHALRGGEERLERDGVVHYVDGFCSENNTVFQFHGNYFHGNPDVYAADEINKKTGKTFGELYQETKRVEEWIVSKGYRLETMWEKDWKAVCKELGLDPTEACENPDYECPTATERKVASSKRVAEKRNHRIDTDAEFRTSQRLRSAKYYRENKNDILQYNKGYRADNKDKIGQKSAEYRAENKDKICQKSAKYYAENKEKLRGKMAKYYTENKDRIREKSAAYRADNKVEIYKRKAKYYAENKDKLREKKAENKEKIREQNARYRAKNGDKIREQKAKYYAENRDRIRECIAEWRQRRKLDQ